MTALPFVAILVKSHESAAEMSRISARLLSDLSVQIRLLLDSQLQDVESICFSFRLNHLQCWKKGLTEEEIPPFCHAFSLDVPFNNCARCQFLISHLLLRDGEERDQPCCSPSLSVCCKCHWNVSTRCFFFIFYPQQYDSGSKHTFWIINCEPANTILSLNLTFF